MYSYLKISSHLITVPPFGSKNDRLQLLYFKTKNQAVKTAMARIKNSTLRTTQNIRKNLVCVFTTTNLMLNN